MLGSVYCTYMIRGWLTGFLHPQFCFGILRLRELYHYAFLGAGLDWYNYIYFTCTQKTTYQQHRKPPTQTVCVYMVCFCDMWLMIVSLVCVHNKVLSRDIFFDSRVSFVYFYIYIYFFLNHKPATSRSALLLFSRLPWRKKEKYVHRIRGAALLRLFGSGRLILSDTKEQGRPVKKWMSSQRKMKLCLALTD